MKNKIYSKLKICAFLIACTLIIGLGGSKAFAADSGSSASIGKWTTMASMKEARREFSSEVINGKIYIMGGVNSSGVLSTVEEYDPLTNTWKSMKSMEEARCDFSSEVINGKIYIIGGSNSSGLMSTVEEYDPTSNIWTKMASMTEARGGFRTAVINGEIYVMGGVNSSGWISSVEKYSPTSNTWIKMSNMNNARSTFDLQIVNGKIYIIGGSNINGALSSVEEYNPITNTWKTINSMKEPRANFKSEVINGKIYAISGRNTNLLSSVERYDFSTNVWSTMNDVSEARFYFNSEVINGKIYIMGGINNQVTPMYLSSLEEYDCLSNRWADMASMKDARYYFNSEVINGKIYVMGGENSSGPLSSVERFDPPETATITLNKTTSSIKAGDTDTLTATTTPSNAGVTWTSSDPTIATVDSNGIVKGIKAGTVTITATMADGSNLSSSCTVTVTEPAEPTTISLNKTSDLIEVGKSDTLTAVVNPDNIGVTWSSSDSSIVTVDANGKITGVKAGTAVVTATTADGKTASCTVTVKDPELGKSKLTLYMNDTTIREFYVTQDELDDFIDWYTSKSKGEVTVRPYYVFNVPSKISSGLKKSYVSFFKIESFEVE